MKTGRKYLFMISCLTFVKGSKHLRQPFIAFSTARQKRHTELEADISVIVINFINIEIKNTAQIYVIETNKGLELRG